MKRTSVEGNIIVYERIFDASPEHTFSVFTTKEHLANWFGPNGFSIVTEHFDFSIGGKWKFTMIGPDGHHYPNIIEFTEIIPNERICYRHVDDEDTENISFRVETSFEKSGRQTRLLIRSIFESEKDLKRVVEEFNALEGGIQTYSRLHNYTLRSNKDENVLILNYHLQAPRELVWLAWTVDEHIEKWYGPQGFSARVEKNDFHEGGDFRYVMIGPDAKEYPSVGTFIEIHPIQRIVSTDEFGEDYIADNAALALPQGMITSVCFEENEDGTSVTVHTSHPTTEQKRQHEEMGVAEGWKSMIDALQDYLSDLPVDEPAEK